MAFELMREMGWTWHAYEETPLLVRQFCWDFIMRRRRVQNTRSDNGGSNSNAVVRRVKY